MPDADDAMDGALVVLQILWALAIVLFLWPLLAAVWLLGAIFGAAGGPSLSFIDMLWFGKNR